MQKISHNRIPERLHALFRAAGADPRDAVDMAVLASELIRSFRDEDGEGVYTKRISLFAAEHPWHKDKAYAVAASISKAVKWLDIKMTSRNKKYRKRGSSVTFNRGLYRRALHAAGYIDEGEPDAEGLVRGRVVHFGGLAYGTHGEKYDGPTPIRALVLAAVDQQKRRWAALADDSPKWMFGKASAKTWLREVWGIEVSKSIPKQARGLSKQYDPENNVGFVAWGLRDGLIWGSRSLDEMKQIRQYRGHKSATKGGTNPPPSVGDYVSDYPESSSSSTDIAGATAPGDIVSSSPVGTAVDGRNSYARDARGTADSDELAGPPSSSLRSSGRGACAPDRPKTDDPGQAGAGAGQDSEGTEDSRTGAGQDSEGGEDSKTPDDDWSDLDWAALYPSSTLK